jgi:putative ABC transport system substrate-binding protein
MASGATTVGLLVNPNNPNAEAHIQEVQTAAQALGRRFMTLRASIEAEFGPNFATLAQAGASGLVVHNDPFFDIRRQQLIALAAAHAVPAIYATFPMPTGFVWMNSSMVSSPLRRLEAEDGLLQSASAPCACQSGKAPSGNGI